MNKIWSLQQPWQLFLFAAILSVVFGIFSSGDAIDIHLHDTYFVIQSPHIKFTLAIYFFMIWMVYWLLRKRLWSNKLVWLHVFLLFISLLLFKSSVFSFAEAGTSFHSFTQKNQLISIAALLFALALLVFFVNITASFIRKKELHD